MDSHHHDFAVALDLGQGRAESPQGLHGLFRGVLLEKTHHGVGHNHHEDDGAFDPFLHRQGQAHSNAQHQAHDVEQVGEEEEERVGGATALCFE